MTPGDRREPPADTSCPPAAQRKQAKRACIYICHGEASNLVEFEVPPGEIQIGVSTGGEFQLEFPLVKI